MQTGALDFRWYRRKFLGGAGMVVVTTMAAVWLFACSEEGITTITTRANSHPIGEPWDGSQTQAATAPEGLPRWSVPAGWQSVSTGESVRLATFSIEIGGEKVEIAVTRFPGDVGGMLANINRWRAQVGLDAVSEAEAESSLELFDTPGFEGYAVRLNGAHQTLFAAGLFEPIFNRTWFVRAIVNAPQADPLADDFRRFVRSFGERTPAHTQTQPQSAPAE